MPNAIEYLADPGAYSMSLPLAEDLTRSGIATCGQALTASSYLIANGNAEQVALGNFVASVASAYPSTDNYLQSLRRSRGGF